VSDVVVCQDVVKAYGDHQVLRGVSFAVRPGEVFGMIGPNGAGKTTLMECIEGLRRHDGGAISVLGLDPQRQTRELRERTGVQLQSSALPTRITVREALELFASFYADPADPRTLLERLGLADKADTYVEKLSGGQRQRVFIALALVNRPEVVFLDELTTGLDPQARLAIWDVVRDIRDAGTTVFLTTHFMEEAERLCDRVAVLDRGRVVALDIVPGLVARLGAPTRLSFTVEGELPLARLEALPDVSRVRREGQRVTVHGSGERFPQEVVGVLSQAGVWAKDLETERASLEAVFLELTGREPAAEAA